jgi:hypothetical protein
LLRLVSCRRSGGTGAQDTELVVIEVALAAAGGLDRFDRGVVSFDFRVYRTGGGDDFDIVPHPHTVWYWGLVLSWLTRFTSRSSSALAVVASASEPVCSSAQSCSI